MNMAVTNDDPSREMVPYVSPVTGAPLTVHADRLATQGESYPVVRGIPRFVPAENYASHFGLQWNAHRQTQLDSSLGTPISLDRLEGCLGMPIARLRGKRVLEAGCGAGRFTEHLVAAGALVHSIDLSSAVDANLDNIGSRPNHRIAQADILTPPFPEGAFDVVLCLGVVQHTRLPEDTIRALWSRVRPGGLLAIDHYAWSLSMVTKLALGYRLVLKRLPPSTAKRVTDRLVDVFFPIHWAVRGFQPAQMLLSRVSPCPVYFRKFPQLSREQHLELTRLDTFDSNTDHYKHLRTARQIRTALEDLGAIEIHVERGGNGIEGRCRKRQP
jgi:2-polyprenyl-3-methyl-5-hydroxy-6-metoxy-1,4-benzoquinol methylase